MDRKLLDYLPPVLQDVLEFQAVNEANEPEISLAWDALALVMANQFLEDADTRGVAVWEKELGIFPKDTDSLESRKAHIKAMWNLELPYSVPWLKNWLTNICGPEGHQEVISDYTIDIQLDYAALPEADRLAEEILKMLLVIRPANMRVLMTALLQSRGVLTYGAFSEFSSQVEIWPRNTRDVAVQADPDGGGAVTGGGTFNHGTQATVIASPEEGYEFVGWQENGVIVSSDESYTFTVEEDCILTAVFVRLYTIGTGMDPEGGGLVEGSGVYREGTNVTVTAAEGNGYRFAAWMEDGAVVSESKSYTFVVEKDRTLTAVFNRCYTISVSADPESGGTVTGGGTYNEGESVTVTAKESSSYTFVAWQENGTPVSADLCYTFTAAENRELTAVFEFISRLPVGYTEVKYIQSGEGQYIANVFTIARTTSKVVMDVEPLSDAAGVFFGENYYATAVSGIRYSYTCQMSMASNGILVNVGKSSGSYSLNSTYGKVVSSDISSRRMKLVLDMRNNIAQVDDTSITISPHTGTYQSIDLLAQYYYNAASGSVSASSGHGSSLRAKLYSCQIYTNDSIVRDFVPCIDPSGAVGLYDLANSKFYASATSTPFIAGPAV